MLATVLMNMPSMLASAATSQPLVSQFGDPPLVEDPGGVLAVLLAVLAIIFRMTRHPTLGRIFEIVPALIFCYFVPTTLTGHGLGTYAGLVCMWMWKVVAGVSG
jgi:hypothetical protein